MRFLAWAVAVVGGLFVLLALSWFGYGLYIRFVVARSPSTMPIVHTRQGPRRLGVYRGGNQVVAPASTPTLPATPRATAVPATPSASPTPVATPRLEANRPVLPPTRLRIPKIGVDAPIVLADNSHLPRFKGISWYLGSGYPGFRGNMVLFGHLNGIYETFGRLRELSRGDLVTVDAVDRTYQYRVTASEVVPENDVAIIAPTRDYRVTLITCTGTFFPLTRDYSDRLIVIGSLVEGGVSSPGG